jgi:hypothetical protein
VSIRSFNRFNCPPQEPEPAGSIQFEENQRMQSLAIDAGACSGNAARGLTPVTDKVELRPGSG